MQEAKAVPRSPTSPIHLSASRPTKIRIPHNDGSHLDKINNSSKNHIAGNPEDDLAFVLPFLAFSGQDAAEKEDLLREHGITHIVNLASKVCQNHFPDSFQYLSLDMLDSDGYNLLDDASKCREFIDRVRTDNGNSKCLVHCVAGRSRSAAIVIAYLIQSLGMSFDEAFDRVAKIRDVLPNFGFLQQLRRLDDNANRSAPSSSAHE